MLRKILASCLLAGAFFAPAATAQKPAKASDLLFIGSQEETILSARFNPASGEISQVTEAASMTRPTWLVADAKRPALFSVSELGNRDQQKAWVHSFAIDSASGALKPLNKVLSGGRGATHLNFDSRSQALFVGNFGSGTVAVIPVGADGSLSEPSSVQTDTGSGPSPRQTGPHAHAAVLDPSGHFVVVADMGADRVFVYRYDAAAHSLQPAATPFLGFGPGTGPRHLAFSPDGHFVFLVTELSAELHSLRFDARTGQLAVNQSLALDPADYKGTRSGSEIAASPDGRFLYVSSRGRNTLHVFAIDKKKGTLKPVQEIASGGKTPRTFLVHPSGRWLIVGNQESNTINVFAIDPGTGKLTPSGQPLTTKIQPYAFAIYQP